MYNNDTLIQVEVSRKPGHSPLCWQKQRYKVRESLHLPIVALSRNVSGGGCTLHRSSRGLLTNILPHPTILHHTLDHTQHNTLYHRGDRIRSGHNISYIILQPGLSWSCHYPSSVERKKYVLG